MNVCGVKCLRMTDGILANYPPITTRHHSKGTYKKSRLCQCSKGNYGCINEPLLNIPLDNAIADELHLFLRITDKLLQNIIDEVLERDAIEDFNKSRGRPKEVYLAKLVKNINDLGISFAAWNKKNADGSESNIKEFTSLLGSQKKKLLKGISSRFNEFLYPDICDTVKKVWID